MHLQKKKKKETQKWKYFIILSVKSLQNSLDSYTAILVGVAQHSPNT